MKSCLICDDHALVREALAGTVRMGWPDAKVDRAGDFPSAWAMAIEMCYDLIVCDLIMPGSGPLAGIDGIIRAAPNSPLLVVTGTEDDALLLDLLDRGVAGFAPKTASGAIIEAAMRLILAGGRYLPPRLAEIASARIEDGSVTAVRDDVARLAESLTERQMQVLRLMAQGLSNKEIARTLNLAPSTVKTHLSQLLVHLGATNRTDASIKARMLDLV
ncbi:MAG: response regulator transcription factor [Novosphingobium sp.]|uniref:LuxR C-terminal-related transcriptional regulator n=1 Tax=Novosphingobium sp. TaxID=1874826 RepID=UPI0027362806|nr:response regulator transcription factor [Novosphingobium sp.]MDP3550820.1 response regulator transcription factor [Novosphingobium sp.]